MAKEFPLSIVIRAIDRATAPIGAVQRRILAMDGAVRARIAAVGGKLAGISEKMGLPVLGAAAGRVGGALGDLTGRLTSVAQGIGAVIGAAGLGGAAMFEMVDAFAEQGSQINDLSTKLGIGTTALQEWQYAAGQTGVDTEVLNKNLGILTKNIGLAAMKKGPAKDAIAALGLKGVTKVEEFLPRLAKKLRMIQDPAKRMAIATTIGGKGFGEMLPMLLDADNTLQDFAKHAHALGIIIPPDAIKQADDFGDKFDDLKLAFKGARNIAAGQLLPVLTDLITRLTGFVAGHGAQIRAWFADFAAKLPGRLEAARQAFDQVVAAMRPVGKVIGWLSDKFGAGNVAIGAIGTALAIFLVPAIYSTATAFYALGVAILTTPVGWILAAIVAIAAAAYLIYKNWGPITAFFRDWWDGTVAVFGVVVDFFAGIWRDVRDGFKDGFLNGIINLFTTLNPVNLIIRAFTELLPRMKQAVAPFLSWFKDGFLGAITPDFAKRLWGIDKLPSRNAMGAANARGTAALGVGAAPGAPATGAMQAPPVGAANAVRGGAAPARDGVAKVQVDFTNLPRGARVQHETKGGVDFALNQGYAMGAG